MFSSHRTIVESLDRTNNESQQYVTIISNSHSRMTLIAPVSIDRKTLETPVTQNHKSLIL